MEPTTVLDVSPTSLEFNAHGVHETLVFNHHSKLWLTELVFLSDNVVVLHSTNVSLLLLPQLVKETSPLSLESTVLLVSQTSLVFNAHGVQILTSQCLPLLHLLVEPA
jgi:hypothetical protein